MYRRLAILVLIAAAVAIFWDRAAQAFTLGYSRGVNVSLERIQFATPVLAPFAHTRHCEAIVPSGEHHLVVVVRVKEGDLVIDNLNVNIRPWNKTQYRWVRIQTPSDPAVWSTVGKTSA